LAETSGTNFTSFAGIVALATVDTVGLGIDAFIVAYYQSLLAGEFTLAVFADLAIFTEVCALSAMSAVGLGIDAITATIGESSLTRDLAFAL
jgi:hypothetical protein